jgi:hypothetical protein
VNFILLGRGGGKTTEVEVWLLSEVDGSPYRYVVVPTQRDKEHLIRDLDGKDGPRGTWEPHSLAMRILTAFEILEGRHRGLRGIFAIDDLDHFLRIVFGGSGEVELVTATPDPVRT